MRDSAASAKVRDFIRSNGMESEVDLLDIMEDSSYYQRLLGLTGRTQVPVLAVDGEVHAGEEEAISWLKYYITAPLRKGA